MTGQWHVSAGTAFWAGSGTAPTQLSPFQEGRGNSLFIFSFIQSLKNLQKGSSRPSQAAEQISAFCRGFTGSSTQPLPQF